MSDQDVTSETPVETRAEDLTDELARKYDPERLLRMVAKRAGKGEALEHSVRHRYEQRFGVDLSHVRVYSGEFAEEFNKRRDAHAVTVGSTGMILMGGTSEKGAGRAAEALLAHELTHVAQQQRAQGGGLHRKSTGGSAMPFAEEHEAEAESVEQSVEQGEHAGPTTAAANASAAKLKAADALKAAIELVKQRVLDMAADAERSFIYRNGVQRRP